MPGDAFLFMSGEEEDPFVSYSPEQREYFLEYYNLDQPLHIQFKHYIVSLCRGDLGRSYHYHEQVSVIIVRRLYWTAFIVFFATLVSIAFGIVIGSISAWNRGTLIDQALYLMLVVTGEVPAFITGLVFLIVFAVYLGWFPLSGAMSHFVDGGSFWTRQGDILRHAVLPVFTLAVARTGGIFLLVRNSLTTVLTRDYMDTARAKGLRKRRIRYVHALRNVLLPLVTRVALQMGGMVGGAILAENVFNYPGLGLLMNEAVRMRDYPLLQGIMIVLALGIILANIIADMIYRHLDPRTLSEDGPKDDGGS